MKTAGEFSSMLKRKQRNELKKDNLLIGVAGQKLKSLVSKVKEGLNLEADEVANEENNYLGESQFETELNSIQKNAERARKTQNDIIQNQNF